MSSAQVPTGTRSFQEQPVSTCYQSASNSDTVLRDFKSIARLIASMPADERTELRNRLDQAMARNDQLTALSQPMVSIARPPGGAIMTPPQAETSKDINQGQGMEFSHLPPEVHKILEALDQCYAMEQKITQAGSGQSAAQETAPEQSKASFGRPLVPPHLRLAFGIAGKLLQDDLLDIDMRVSDWRSLYDFIVDEIAENLEGILYDYGFKEDLEDYRRELAKKL